MVATSNNSLGANFKANMASVNGVLEEARSAGLNPVIGASAAESKLYVSLNGKDTLSVGNHRFAESPDREIAQTKETQSSKEALNPLALKDYRGFQQSQDNGRGGR